MTLFCLKKRIVGYTKNALAFNGVIKVDRLGKTFCNRTSISYTHNRFKIKKLLLLSAKENGLYAFRNKAEPYSPWYIMQNRPVGSAKKVLKNSISLLLAKDLNRNGNKPVLIYAFVEKILSKNKRIPSRRTLERRIAILQKNAQAFGLSFFKVGRELYVQKSKDDFRKNTRQTTGTPSNIYKLKEINKTQSTDPRPGTSRSNQPKRKKAFWLMRQLKTFFWDNVKVRQDDRMLFRYCEWSLSNGFDEADIRRVFYSALTQRHKDATDFGLNTSNPTLHFELSSTVSFAKNKLMLAPRPWMNRHPNRPVDQDSHPKTTIRKLVPQAFKSDDNAFLMKTTISNNTTQQRPSLDSALSTAGFNKTQIAVFNHLKDTQLTEDHPYASYRSLIMRMKAFAQQYNNN